MIACAEWLKHKFLDLGFQAEVYETGGHPSVIARTPHHPAQPTILVYGHYDVQPPEPLATMILFLTLRAFHSRRPHLCPRLDSNKGQIMAHIVLVTFLPR